MKRIRHHARRIILEGLGWLLVLVGLAALVLPGPGLLALFAGLALLATQYQWAERRLEPVRKAAMRAAAESVQSLVRILASGVACLILLALGFVWGLQPAIPAWWPIDDKWWLIGGWGTGSTLIFSGTIAFVMLVYSYVTFRKKS